MLERFHLNKIVHIHWTCQTTNYDVAPHQPTQFIQRVCIRIPPLIIHVPPIYYMLPTQADTAVCRSIPHHTCLITFKTATSRNQLHKTNLGPQVAHLYTLILPYIRYMHRVSIQASNWMMLSLLSKYTGLYCSVLQYLLEGGYMYITWGWYVYRPYIERATAFLLPSFYI